MASNLNVTLEPATLDVIAGAETTARITIQNRGSLVGQYQLSASAPAGASITFDPDQLGIFPGSSAVSVLRLSTTAAITPATYPAALQVVDQNDPSETARTNFRVNVRAGAQSRNTPSFSGGPPPGLPEAGVHSSTTPPFTSPEAGMHGSNHAAFHFARIRLHGHRV